ncbi:hypothetical protein CK203_010357 [Vitis vinifera]|uniref:Uncharacterized protein n=1 Tax=Vitis vinifera TaxID=29760 RepID=A0A438JXJ7_VITVI|nr:hypothetical protein CK203_010357 [Vitis vinifera]
MDGHVILNTQGVLDSVVAPAKRHPDRVSRGYQEIPFLLRAKVLVGALSSYEWLSETMVGDAAVRDRGKRLCRMIVGSDLLSLPLVFSFCRRYPFFFFGAVFGTHLFATAVPLVAFAGSLHLFSGLLGIVLDESFLLWLCGKKWLQKKTVSSVRVSEAGEKAIDKLNAKEFRERFRIPHDVLIDLVNEEAAMPSEKGGKNAILFTKEQFNAGLRFPLPALLKEFLHFSQIPPIFIHPNLVRVLMGCSIINMLYSLDLTLLELFFVYSLKKAKNDIFSGVRSPALPSNGDRTARFDKGGRRAGGSLGFGIEGPPCGLGGKGVLCLQVVREPQEYVINILPRKLANDEIVPGEHYTVKELPLYQEAKEADAERRRKLLEDRDQKKN